jgi:hypothetical protein
MTEPSSHFYAFTLRPSSPIPFYERTFSSKAGFDYWEAHHARHPAFYTINCLPKRYWY